MITGRGLRTVCALALFSSLGVANAQPFTETFGSTATRQPSLYVPQFTAAGAVSFYRFANPAGTPQEKLVDDGTYTVINPSQVIPTGGGQWWANNATGPAANLRDHTGNNGAVLVVNAGNVANALYRRVVSLEGGKTYTFSVWRYIVAGPTDLSLELREPNDSAGLAQSPNFTTTGATGAGQWTRLAWSFTTDACSTRQYAVSLRNNSPVVSGNDLFFDDISVQEEAGAQALVAPCSTTSVPTVNATDDSGSTTPGQPVVINVLTNDASSSPATAALGKPSQAAVSAQNGVVVFNADGSVTYTPNAGFTGNDSFTYAVCTVASQSNPTPVCSSATVSISVAAPPVVAPSPAAIPTLSEWGLIFMSGLLALFGIASTRRRH